MNRKIKSFNLRVYALIIERDSILVSRELIGGKYLYKFPGGGLQYGEGLIEGLQRESMEEMNQNLKNIKHFYTTDFFQQSQFDSKDQLIAIYYKAKLTSKINNKIKRPLKNKPLFVWIDIKKTTKDFLTFPIDKIVLEKIKHEIKKKRN